jgi:anti-sigma factor RsiW
MMGDRPSELDLMAFADGELDAGAHERVRQYVLGHPEAAAKVKAYQQLRDAGCRACKSGVDVPQHLQDRVAGLANPPSYDDRGYPMNADGQPVAAPANWQSPMRTARRPMFGYRIMAAAALLIVGIGVVAMILMPAGTKVINDPSIVPVGWVHTTAEVHTECSRHASHFGAGFPQAVEELPASLRQYLGHDAIVPDLSKLGYKFAGAGPCQIPGGKTVHLLYRPAPGGSISQYTVSLFVQPDKNQLKLEKGKVYFANDAIDKTPMIIWRGDGVVYYLVGEDKNQLRDAAGQIGMKVRI